MQSTHHGGIRSIGLESAPVESDQLVNSSDLRALILVLLLLLGCNSLGSLFCQFLNRNLILDIIPPLELLVRVVLGNFDFAGCLLVFFMMPALLGVCSSASILLVCRFPLLLLISLLLHLLCIIC